MIRFGSVCSGIEAASVSQPAKVPTSATGGDWTQPTTVALRLGDAMQLLCGGKRPPDDMVQQWLDNTSESLQEFAASNGPAWAQGIGLIDAALVLVDQPTEVTAIDNTDRDHERRAARAHTADSVLEDATRAAARALSDRVAEMCNVDKEDHWKYHSDDVLSDAELVVSTYLAARAPAESVLEDAARWQWLADYLIGERTDLDEGIVACTTVDALRQFADAARKQGANHD